ncbi:MAG: hypothetical protein ABIH89_01525 [Elusimicrobiota bacterium]
MSKRMSPGDKPDLKLVYEETKDNLTQGNFSWIPEDIASGIYIAHVNGPGVNVKKKIAILR